jgi:hypothetical protein
VPRDWEEILERKYGRATVYPKGLGAIRRSEPIAAVDRSKQSLKNSSRPAAAAPRRVSLGILARFAQLRKSANEGDLQRSFRRWDWTCSAETALSSGKGS